MSATELADRLRHCHSRSRQVPKCQIMKPTIYNLSRSPKWERSTVTCGRRPIGARLPMCKKHAWGGYDSLTAPVWAAAARVAASRAAEQGCGKRRAVARAVIAMGVDTPRQQAALASIAAAGSWAEAREHRLALGVRQWAVLTWPSACGIGQYMASSHSNWGLPCVNDAALLCVAKVPRKPAPDWGHGGYSASWPLAWPVASGRIVSMDDAWPPASNPMAARIRKGYVWPCQRHGSEGGS